MEANQAVAGGKYLCFRLSNEEYGMPILNVREIIGMMDFAVVPQTHAYVRGIINLRGKIVPIIDLRSKFGLDELAYDERTCIIIVEANGGNRKVVMGLVVDAVTEVNNFKTEDIEPAPEAAKDLTAQYVTGIAKAGAKIKILLDANAIVSQTDLVIEA